jgi:hypothetical protein
MPEMSVGEATHVVHTILNMEVNKIISKEEALKAIKKVPHYSEFLDA